MSSTFVPASRLEVLTLKLEIWRSRLAYALESDPSYVAECRRAVADLSERIVRES